jgi:hypothetical protein
VISTDHDHLNKGVMNPNAMSDGQKAGINVQTKVGGLFTYNTGSDAPATHRDNVTKVQLQAPTGLVKVPGMDHVVTPEVLERMKETSPELFLEPEAKAAKQAEAADAAAASAAEEAKREELNRFVDPAAEGVAMHISNDVEFGDQVRLLHELHTTGTVSTATLNRFADQMHMSVDETVAAVNAVHMNTSLQVATLCKVAGVDAQAFNTYMKTHHSNEMFKAIQVHSQERDMQRAWSGHIAAFKARGGR